MTYKTLEIYYDVDRIPGISDRSDWSGEALAFRNRAMEHVEAALERAGAGEWVGAEIGAGEVNFGFEVEDFDQAEAVIRAAVAGTEFEGFREIERHEMTEEEMAAAAEAAENFKMPLRMKLALVFAVPLALVILLFKLLTLPLRLLARRG